VISANAEFIPVFPGGQSRMLFKQTPERAAVFIADLTGDFVYIVGGGFQSFFGGFHPNLL